MTYIELFVEDVQPRFKASAAVMPLVASLQAGDCEHHQGA
jgi:hypothetical protein